MHSSCLQVRSYLWHQIDAVYVLMSFKHLKTLHCWTFHLIVSIDFYCPYNYSRAILFWIINECSEYLWNRLNWQTSYEVTKKLWTEIQVVNQQTSWIYSSKYTYQLNCISTYFDKKEISFCSRSGQTLWWITELCA